MKNKKKKSECEIGNGDCDFGARPTEHSARVLSCKISFVQLKTYLAESCDSIGNDKFMNRRDKMRGVNPRVIISLISHQIMGTIANGIMAILYWDYRK